MGSAHSASSTVRENGRHIPNAFVRGMAAAGIALVAVFSAAAASDLSTAGTPLILSAVSNTTTTSGTATISRDSSYLPLVRIA
ncbi:hypothetical protein [Frankia sp. Cppng1_Ct_nod]|uniref:hypothetical protein n=1 Tax=Frankia sp. Cppng1_Ct_nod TaxID=2897162 RepID=UPI0020245B55|nr:hypothetical protein [Frankia sp. Cppng1_Ct_nod]